MSVSSATEAAPAAKGTVEAAAVEVAAIEQEVAALAAPAPETPATPEPVAEQPAATTTEPAPAAPVAAVDAPAEPRRERYLLPMAAAIVLAAGLGWGGGVLSRPAPKAEPARLAKAVEQLRAEVAALKEGVAQGAARSQPVSLAPLMSRLDVLAEAIDKSQRDVQARIAGLAKTGGEKPADKALAEAVAPLMARLERIEKSLATGSVGPTTPATLASAQPLPPKPAEAKGAESSLAKLPGFVLQEVDDGIAVITDRQGMLYEVMRGEPLPGAGRVQKIERRAGAWVVVTDKGLIGGR